MKDTQKPSLYLASIGILFILYDLLYLLPTKGALFYSGFAVPFLFVGFGLFWVLSGTKENQK